MHGGREETRAGPPRHEGILSLGSARLGQGCIVAARRAQPESRRERNPLTALGSRVTGLRLGVWPTVCTHGCVSVGVPAMVIAIGRSSMELVPFLRTCGRPERTARCLACTRPR